VVIWAVFSLSTHIRGIIPQWLVTGRQLQPGASGPIIATSTTKAALGRQVLHHVIVVGSVVGKSPLLTFLS
jgi:hypothetical protein